MKKLEMSETTRPYNEIDDYIAAFSDEERQEYVAAETALDLACILYQIRQEQGFLAYLAYVLSSRLYFFDRL